MANGAEALHNFNIAYAPNADSVVFAETADDIKRGVRMAVAAGRGVAVQSTGHGRFDTSDDAVLIATQRMTGIQIDSVRRTARMEAGVRWGQVIAETVKFGLAPVHGSSPTVGVMGYTLSGGVGLLSRAFGYSADTVLSIDIITAEGELITATPEHHQDLFWGVRGGKGSFGVVTAIEVQLFPIPRFYGGALYFHPDAAGEVLPAFAEWARTLPEWLAPSIAFGRVPAIDGLPSGLSHTLHVRCTSIGPSQESAALLAPLRALSGLLADTVDEKPYARIPEVHNDRTDPLGYIEKSRYLPRLTEELIQQLVAAYRPGIEGPAPHTDLRLLGGAMARTPDHPNCVGGRGSEFSVMVVARADGDARARFDDVFRVADDASTGQSVLNFQGIEASAEQVLAAFDPEDRDTLVNLKRRRDPENIFRHGHVIPA